MDWGKSGVVQLQCFNIWNNGGEESNPFGNGQKWWVEGKAGGSQLTRRKKFLTSRAIRQWMGCPGQ